jgi:SagB-type dehydrogenase family enzyme
MRLRQCPGLGLLNLPHGLGLHAPGFTSVFEADVLSQPGFLRLLTRCHTWCERAEAEDSLIESGLDAPTAERAIGELLDAGILIADDNPKASQLHAQAESWTERGWRGAFEFHLHVGAIPRMDYRDDEALKADVATMKEFAAAEPLPSNYKELPGSALLPLQPYKAAKRSSAPTALSELLSDRPGFFEQGPLSFSDFSRLTYLAFGQVSKKSFPFTGEHVLRTSPSGGSRHPTEVYPIVFSVEGVPTGLYHYNVKRHGLEAMRPGDHSAFVREHLLMLPDRATWPHAVVYLCSTLFERSMFRYRDSFSYRVVHHDIGHLLQTVALLAGDVSRRCYRSYALHHDSVERWLAIDGISEAAIAFAVVG